MNVPSAAPPCHVRSNYNTSLLRLSPAPAFLGLFFQTSPSTMSFPISSLQCSAPPFLFIPLFPSLPFLLHLIIPISLLSSHPPSLFSSFPSHFVSLKIPISLFHPYHIFRSLFCPTLSSYTLPQHSSLLCYIFTLQDTIPFPSHSFSAYLPISFPISYRLNYSS